MTTSARPYTTLGDSIFERNRYSVPASFANRPVSLHIYPKRLVIVAQGHVIRDIERSHRHPGRVIYDWRHYLALAVASGARTVAIVARTMARGAPAFEAASR